MLAREVAPVLAASREEVLLAVLENRNQRGSGRHAHIEAKAVFGRPVLLGIDSARLACLRRQLWPFW